MITQANRRNAQAPLSVLMVNASMPLVVAGGPRVNTEELRCDFYDAEAAGWSRAAG